MAPCPAHNGQRQRGAGLIEVLVAVLVLAVGLLGVAGLQLVSLRNNHSAALRSQAVVMAYDALDRMRANRTAALTGSYAIAFTDPAPACTTVVAACDLREWKQALSTLPSGQGAITSSIVGGRTQFTVTVQWDDSRGVLAPQQFTAVSEL